jgi:NTP pyrophosphatase (non-canonical NTP hydrolase)
VSAQESQRAPCPVCVDGKGPLAPNGHRPRCHWCKGNGTAGPWVTLDDFQDEVDRTLAPSPTSLSAESPRGFLAAMALGVAGEAGEVADLVKKHVAHGHELSREKLTKELGDVMWYLAALARLAGIDLSEVATENARKLRARYPDGFSEERSKNRLDVAAGAP